MKLWWSLMMVMAVILSIAAARASAETDLWEEDDKEVLVRSVRGTKERVSGSSASCRYEKNSWSECDPKTNTKTRKLTLKKGAKTCEESKTIQKKCKKVAGGATCRYEKGTFGGCVNQTMARVDTLKPNSNPSCEQSRRITKTCKSDNNTKKSNKGDRSNKKTGKQ